MPDFWQFKHVQSTFQIAEHRFQFRIGNKTFAKSGIICDVAVMNFHNYNEQNYLFTMNNSTSLILTKVCADPTFGPLKRKQFYVTLTVREEKASGPLKCSYHFISKLEQMMACRLSFILSVSSCKYLPLKKVIAFWTACVYDVHPKNGVLMTSLKPTSS